MHINDVKAFAAKVNLDAIFGGKKVVIRAPQDKGGKYLNRRGQFAADKKDAFVYDYDKDGVSKQVEFCIANGMPLEVEEA
jgi:hypothetical protein